MDPNSFLFAKKIILVILLFKKCKNTFLTFMNLKMTIVSLWKDHNTLIASFFFYREKG